MWSPGRGGGGGRGSTIGDPAWFAERVLFTTLLGLGFDFRFVVGFGLVRPVSNAQVVGGGLDR